MILPMDIMTLIYARRVNITLAEFAEAVGIIVQCIVYMTIIDVISDIVWSRKIWFVKLACSSLNLLIWFYIVQTGNIWSVVGIVLDTLGYFLYLYILKRQNISIIFAVVMETELVNQIGAILVTLVVFVIDTLVQNGSYHIFFLYSGYIFRIILLYALYYVEKKYRILKLLIETKAKYIIVIGMLFQFTRFIFRTYYEDTESIFLYVALAIFVTGVLFCVLWLIDWYYNEREKKLLLEDNNRMSKRLHKSKELIPALNSALTQLKTNNNSSEFSGILEEIHQLCKEQLDESEQWDMQEKIFPPTGIHILDEQIQLYGIEAAKKGINLDVFVGVQLPETLKERQIKELDFLRLIGDLMRNAFRAIEKTEKENGNILLVMGCVGDIFQVDIYDDGVPFPLFILNEFGKRGNTQGGTGNGIADMMDFLERHQATYQLTEYEESATFSKGISIIWNYKNERWIDSSRKTKISESSLLLPKKL